MKDLNSNSNGTGNSSFATAAATTTTTMFPRTESPSLIDLLVPKQHGEAPVPRCCGENQRSSATTRSLPSMMIPSPFTLRIAKGASTLDPLTTLNLPHQASMSSSSPQEEHDKSRSYHVALIESALLIANEIIVGHEEDDSHAFLAGISSTNSTGCKQ